MSKSKLDPENQGAFLPDHLKVSPQDVANDAGTWDESIQHEQGWRIDEFAPTSLCEPTLVAAPTLQGDNAYWATVPLSDADCAAATAEVFGAAKQRKIAELTAQRDNRLNGYLWFDATGTPCWYALGRSGDYFARLNMLSSADAADAANAPHSRPLTCLVGSPPAQGEEAALSVNEPAGVAPQQINHTAAQIQAILLYGEPYISDIWTTWSAVVTQAELAQTQVELNAVAWP